MVVTLGDCQSRTQMGERIFIRKYRFGRIGSRNRVIDCVAGIPANSEVMSQRRQVRLEFVLVDFLDRRACLGV